MAKKRTLPKQLVSNSIALSCSRSRWIDKLQQRDRDYIMEIVEEARKHPDVVIKPLAHALIVELDLKISQSTVAQTLKELLSDEA